MYLKSLTIRGFKSFSKKTTLTFEPGMTAIIGPNGSGKSNIVDAVLWVFGEQNPRFLRGQSMGDVIFAGSESEPPSPFAEVTVVFDNADGRLPVPQSEVSIRRRVTRDGESAYFVNERPCRLVDIRDLVAHAGLGEELPGIVPQNRLLELVDSSRSDLRAIIEEASGLAYYRRRKDAALRRIVRVDERVDALRAVKAEVDRELKPLKRQVEKMRRAAELRDALRKAELTMAALEFGELKRRFEEIEQEAAITEAMLADVARREADIERRREALERRFADRDSLARDEAALARLREIQERGSIFRALIEEKGRNLVEAFSRARQELHVIERRMEEADREARDAESRLAVLREREADLGRRLLGCENDTKEARSRLEAARREAIACRSRVAEAERAAREAGQAAAQAAAERARRAREEEELAERAAAYERRAVELAREVERERAAAARAAERLASAERELAERVEQRSTLERRRSEAMRALGEAEAEAGSLAARLAEVEHELERRSDGRRTVGAIAASASGLLDGDAKRIAGVLDGLADAVVVSAAEAREAVAKGERRPLLVVEGEASAGSERGVPAGVARFVGRYRAVETLVEALEAWLRDGTSGYVASDGSRVTPDGFVLPAPAASNRVLLERERAALVDRLAAARERAEAARGDLSEVERELEAVRAAVEAAEPARAEAYAAREAAAAREARLVREIREAEAAAEGARTARERARKALEEAERRLEDAEAERLACDERLAAARDASEAVERALAAAEGRVREAAARGETDRAVLAEVRAQAGYLAERVAALAEERKRLVERKEAFELALAARERARERVQRAFAAARAIEDAAAARLGDLTAARAGELERLEAFRREAAELMRLSAEVSAQKERLLTRKEVLAAQRAEVATRVAVKADEIVEETGMTIEKALAGVDVAGVDVAAVRRERDRLRREIESVGEYNPLAERDYERLKARSEFFERQIADLVEASENLRTIIEEVDRRMVETFTGAFGAVSEEFARVFERLTGGGRGAMRLEDEARPLESAIAVSVQPPGKKVRRLSLLSGGEKSLASLACVFALARVFRIPFLLLDEVEPALDDVNLSRLIDVMREVSRESQIIIVSHQARTIDEADVVYGVTMARNGVSSVYGQRFREPVEADA